VCMQSFNALAQRSENQFLAPKRIRVRELETRNAVAELGNF